MNRVPFSVIQAAKACDSEAIDFIIRHFCGYITRQASSVSTDEYGNRRSFVDDDLFYEAINAVFAAIQHFQFRQPPKDFSA